MLYGILLIYNCIVQSENEKSMNKRMVKRRMIITLVLKSRLFAVVASYLIERCYLFNSTSLSNLKI